MMQGWPEERCALCGLKAKMNMGCGADDPLYIRLRPCGRCKQLRYCNRTCQQNHWKAHKEECYIPGDGPPPPCPDDLRALISKQIASKGLYVYAHAPGASGDAVTLHTVGFHSHAQPELLLRAVPRNLLQRAGGLLTYARCERAVDAPLKDGEVLRVNGLSCTAARLSGTALDAANAHDVTAARGYYGLRKAAANVDVILLVLDEEHQKDDEPIVEDITE
ncbi:hypothetical protein M885DRAFT_586360 [Pelagophyceae sp. CCMP2097]|nr:hypothetical protein M885DRAFT_586360 [Pelagophyceae sp. CCMP2097]